VNTVLINDAHLFVVEQGDVRTHPVLFIHGFPFSHAMWQSQIGAVSRSFRAIAYDVRGLGGSSVGDGQYTIEGHVDDLIGLLDHLAITKAVIIGLSMGGYIAFQVWRKYAARLRGLILCDTRATADTPDAAAALHAMAERVLREGLAPLVETMLPKLLAETTWREQPQVVEGLREVLRAGNPRGIAAAARGMAERPDMTSALGEIRCPTLVIVGQEDVISPPAEMRGMAEAIPGARFIEISAAGHMAPLENPAAVNAAILAFLSTVR